MAGLLSRLKKGDEDLLSDAPLSASDSKQRGQLLASLEKSDLGWFWSSDARGNLSYISSSAARRIGKPSQELVGRVLTEVFLPIEDIDSVSHERPLKFQLAARNSIKPVTVRVENGESEAWWEIAGVPQLDKSGNFQGYHGIVRDVSDTFESKRDAEKMSRYDSLTGLSNRHRMSQQLGATLTAFKASQAVLRDDADRP